MYFQNQENDTVCSQPLSSNGDESCSHLPGELIAEILVRLPVRSILQFKCICKLWKTLISNPQFVKRQLQVSTAEPCLTHQLLFFYQISESDKLLYYPLKPLFESILPPLNFIDFMKPEYYIIGSCNGLLCLFYNLKNVFRLCNPSIRFKSKKSPQAFSLDWMIMHCGFGYDQVHDKYKVLFVVENKNDLTQTLTKIYTFGDDSWKTIQNFPRYPCDLSNLDVYFGKFVSGTLNWIFEKRDVRSNQSVILSFDLESETYKEILPPQDSGDDKTLYVLNNCLGVCYDEINKTHWVAWLMKEYGVVDSWTKFIIIPHDKFNKQPSFVIPIFISENGLVLLKNKYTSHFVLYNLNSGHLDCSWDNSLVTVNTFRQNLHICCESLVSL